jgi:hypothetical protein
MLLTLRSFIMVLWLNTCNSSMTTVLTWFNESADLALMALSTRPLPVPRIRFKMFEKHKLQEDVNNKTVCM